MTARRYGLTLTSTAAGCRPLAGVAAAVMRLRHAGASSAHRPRSTTSSKTRSAAGRRGHRRSARRRRRAASRVRRSRSVEQQVDAEVVETVEQQVESAVVDDRPAARRVRRRRHDRAAARKRRRRRDRAAARRHDRRRGRRRARRRRSNTRTRRHRSAPRSRRRRPATTRTMPERRARGNERFFAEVDAAGRAAEREVWIILVPARVRRAYRGWGFTVRERHDLATLDRVLLRVDAPEDRDIAQAALELALERPARSSTSITSTATARTRLRGRVRRSRDAGAAARAADAAADPRRTGGLAIGIVDSAVARRARSVVARPTSCCGTSCRSPPRVPRRTARPSRRSLVGDAGGARRLQRRAVVRGVGLLRRRRRQTRPRPRRASWPRSNGSCRAGVRVDQHEPRGAAESRARGRDRRRSASAARSSSRRSATTVRPASRSIPPRTRPSSA